MKKVKGVIEDWVENFEDKFWELLENITLFVSVIGVLGVVWAFINIFYSLGGGTGADLVNPNDW